MKKTVSVETALVLYMILFPSILATFNDTITFLDHMNMVRISPATIVLVEELETLVMKKQVGDRPVKRYYEKYNSPFADLNKKYRAF